MSALSIQPTFPIFTDIDGQPLEAGYVWIGQANLDPQVNPINVYWDAALTIPAAQPIRTIGGYPSRNGTPARLYVNSDYSIRVMNRNGSAVYSAPAATERYNNTVITGINAQNVVYDPPFTGAVASNVEAKLAQEISVLDFGAVGNGIADDTAAIQAALDSGARCITGNNLSYVVTTIFPRSNQILQDIRLICKATATQVSLRPVVKVGGVIGGVVQPVTNLILSNVIVNGNRQNLADIFIGNGEDGGMHGFKIADGANGIKLLNCEASYCGTAALVLHSEASGTAADYPIKNVYVEDFSGTYNREHGMFGDSFDGFYINRAIFTNNGSTIAAGFPPTNGNSPFINPGDGLPFGSGFDLECYVGFPKSYFKNFYASDVVCKTNATPVLLYAPPVVDAVAQIPAENIFMRNVWFERGTNNVSDTAFQITANSFVGEKYGVDNVQISGYLDGIVSSNNARRVIFVDGYIKAPTALAYKAVFNNGKDSSITVPSNKPYVRVETFSASSVATNTGAGVFTGAFAQLMQSNGLHTLIMPFSVAGGTVAGGPMSFTITLPTQVKAVSAQINAFNSTSGVSVVSNVSVLSETQVRVFMTPIDDNVSGNLEVEILF